MNNCLQSIFKPAKLEKSGKREKFLSRVFGIYSEEIVRLWADDHRSPYESLGRPTIKSSADSKKHTLDFTFQDRITGRVFVVEMKCEIEYQNFKYFVLESVEQLQHHNKPAFGIFLECAARSAEHSVYVKDVKGKSKLIATEGAILIWGAASPEGRRVVKESTGLHDILTIEDICRDLSKWKQQEYRELIAERQAWCAELFDGLVGGQT